MNSGLNTYGYVGGNPVGYIDPFGLEAATATAMGAGVASGAITVNPITLILGGWAIPSPLADGTCPLGDCNDFIIQMNESANDWVDHPDAAKEHDEYKDKLLVPLPPGDPCKTLRRKLNRQNQLIRDMQRWDRRWSWYGYKRHAGAIKQAKRARDRYKRRIKRECSNRCR